MCSCSGMRSGAWRIGRRPKRKEEKDEGKERDPRTDRGNLIPSFECFWIVWNTTWSSCKSKEVSWEEGKINAEESRPEVNLTCKWWNCNTKSLFPPVVDTKENSENRTSRKNVVEVGNNVVSVMEGDVKTTVRESNTSKTTSSEEEEETDRKEGDWLASINTSSPSSSSPAKDLNTSRNSNNSSCCSKVCTSVNV